MLRARWLLSSIVLLACLPASRVLEAEEGRPDVVIILVDDMGFSDIGCYGGEIETPNIDALAAGGVRFSQFYNSGRCCPTRATLMTGLHPHQTGIGWMTNPPNNTRGYDRPEAYRGYLNRQCVTLVEVLRPAGYSTLMAGKWHLGFNERDRWPLQRGFDRYFGCISGATRFFYPKAPRGMTLGNEAVESHESTTDRPFYTTDAFTDHAIRFVREQVSTTPEKPFFLYLAYTAPHWPLQAHEEDIARYRGKYRIGWDEVRRRRLARQIELGLMPKGCKLSPRDERVPAWDTLDAELRDLMDLKMAIYAAMIDRVDQNIGKLIAALREAGRFENTLLLFLSDNGGCAEGGIFGRGEFHDVAKRNQERANSYGVAWANVSSTPYRLYKHFTHEGGAATPFFLHWPARIPAREDWYREPAQLIDILPTLLEATGAQYPKEFAGRAIPNYDGVSLLPAGKGQSLGRAAPICIEHENNASIRQGDWKLVGRGVSPPAGIDAAKWELYDIAKDRNELHNLASSQPERVRQMAAEWKTWAERVGVWPKAAPKPKPKQRRDGKKAPRRG